MPRKYKKSWQLMTAYFLFVLCLNYALYSLFLLCIDAPIISPTVYLYWALGRGMMNGLSLYNDFFETKPPGIALISFFSLRLFGNQILGYVLYIITLLALPYIFMRSAYQSGKKRVQKILLAALTLTVIVMLEKYLLRHPGGWGLDYFGAVSCLFYVFLLQWPCKKRWLQFGLLSLSIFCAVGLKESFAISIFASAIIFLPTTSALISGFFLPFLTAATTGILSLFALGMAHGYFNVYLREMFGHYLEQRHQTGSFWERFLISDKVFGNFNDFFPHITLVLLALFLIPICFAKTNAKRSSGMAGILTGFCFLLPLASSVSFYLASDTASALFIGSLLILLIEYFRRPGDLLRMMQCIWLPFLLMLIEMLLLHPLFFFVLAPTIQIRNLLFHFHAYEYFIFLAAVTLLSTFFSSKTPRRNGMLRTWTVMIAVLLGIAGVSLAGDYQGQHFFVMVPVYVSIFLIAMNAMIAAWTSRFVPYVCGGIVLVLLVIQIAAPLQHELYSLKDYPKNLAAHMSQRELLETRAKAIDRILDACGVDRYLTLDNGLYVGLTQHTPLNFYFWPMLESAAYEYHPIVGFHTIRNIKTAQIAFASAPDSVVIATGVQNDIDESIALLLQHGVKLIETPWPCAENLPEPPGLTVYYRDQSY